MTVSELIKLHTAGAAEALVRSILLRRDIYSDIDHAIATTRGHAVTVA